MPTAPDEVSRIEFKAGDFLFREDEKSFHFYIIQKGQVEVFKSDHRGEKIPLATVTDGASLGEFAMIDQLPRSASAQAKTPVIAICVSERAYQKLLQDLPEWALSVMKSLVERLRSTNEIVRSHHASNDAVMREMDVAEYDTTASRKREALPERDDYDPDDTPDLA